MSLEESSAQISNVLLKQIEKRIFEEKSAKIVEVLKLVGAGFFLAASFAAPNLPKMLAPFFKPDEKEAWKRFNIPYLKRVLNRLEKQELVEITTENGEEIVKITEMGRVKILKSALNELSLEKPVSWDGNWWIVIYDIPKRYRVKRDIFRSYLKVWRFYPLQESVFIHAYPCRQQIEFLRDYLGIGQFVRILKVSRIENDENFRQFFDV